MVRKQPDIHKKKQVSRDKPYTFSRISSKEVIDLKVENRIIKLLEDNTRENIGDLWFADDFFDTTPKA